MMALSALENADFACSSESRPVTSFAHRNPRTVLSMLLPLVVVVLLTQPPPLPPAGDEERDEEVEEVEDWSIANSGCGREDE